MEVLMQNRKFKFILDFQSLALESPLAAVFTAIACYSFVLLTLNCRWHNVSTSKFLLDLAFFGFLFLVQVTMCFFLFLGLKEKLQVSIRGNS